MTNQVEKAKNARRYQPVSEDLVEPVAKQLAAWSFMVSLKRIEIEWRYATQIEKDAYIEQAQRLISLIRPSIEQVAKKQGRKDVVDWIIEDKNCFWNYYYLRFKVEVDEWKEKLKEWGLSKEVE